MSIGIISYNYIYTHIYIYTYIHIYIYTYMHVCLFSGIVEILYIHIKLKENIDI